MRFYNRDYQYYCGIDLHTKMMYVCILNNEGEICLHQNIQTQPHRVSAANDSMRLLCSFFFSGQDQQTLASPHTDDMNRRFFSQVDDAERGMD